MSTKGTKEVRIFLNDPAPQTLSIGTSEVKSQPFDNTEILITTTVDCYWLIDSDPTASTASHFMPAGCSWPIGVLAAHKISVIAPDGAGSFYISAIR